MTMRGEVVAFAGRRIDAPDAAPSRFPESSVARVEREIAAFLDGRGVSAVVGSAACGADLLVLEAACARKLRTRVVLPFDVVRFRETSVVDRGAGWGPRYDAAIAYTESAGDVIVLPASAGTEDDAYARATDRILAEAIQLSHERGVAAIALAIWDRRPRSQNDATRQFIDLAKSEGLSCVEISTC